MGQETVNPNKWDENIHTWNSSVIQREYFRKKNGHFLRRGDVKIRVGCYSNLFNLGLLYKHRDLYTAQAK